MRGFDSHHPLHLAAQEGIRACSSVSYTHLDVEDFVKIANVLINGYGALAPMAGVADAAFRRVAREFGAAYTVTEMISAKGLMYGDRKTAELMRLAPDRCV